MSEKNIKKMIGETFLELSEGLRTGKIGKQIVIGLAIEGSEHGDSTIEEAVRLATSRGNSVHLIKGENVHKQMETLLREGTISAAVTMHYPFPIGVSTVGKVVTPAKGKSMYLSTTTGTSDTDRQKALIKNALYGIICAKADGIENPTVGIANIDGARACEKALNQLKENGYPIHFSESSREDGGVVMRGNDLLQASSDVMVMDSLTGNLMCKIFSSYTTGGAYESLGWGYGPGIGEHYEDIILIISRASGAPVIAGAIEYATQLAQSNLPELATREISLAKAAGLDKILESLSPKESKPSVEEVKQPPKEVVTSSISGIEVMDLDDALRCLWKAEIYSETGMGCTGPILRVSEENLDHSITILKKNNYL